MKVLQTAGFKDSVLKLSTEQKLILDQAIYSIMEKRLKDNDSEKDLCSTQLYVYKFKLLENKALFSYLYNKKEITLVSLEIS